MHKKVTILIPCYNGAKYLQRCLDSCISQTYPNIEILIVNDGSNDLSQSIIESYTKKHDYIKLINQTNKGSAAARNVLLANINTPYGFFLDADDWIEPDCIQYFMENYDGSDLMINSAYVNRKGKQSIFYVTRKISNKTDSESYLIDNTPFIWNIFFKTEYLKTNNFWFLDKPFFEDSGLLTYFIYKTRKIKFLNEPKYHYFINKESLSHFDINKPKIISAFCQLEYFYKLIQNENFISYPRPINDQLALYHCILFSYIQFKSKLSKRDKKFFRWKLKNLENKHQKIKFPKRYWKFWYFFLYRTFGY